MERRFGDAARIVYHDVQDPSVRSTHGGILEEIDTKGLLYPVTVIESVPVYDGAVSYPGILRAVHDRLERLHA